MIDTVGDLIAALQKLDKKAPVEIALYTDAHGEYRATTKVGSVRLWASGSAILTAHLPSGYAIQRRKPKF